MGKTRFIVRVRPDYSDGVANALSAMIPNEIGSLLMRPKTMHEIKARAEWTARAEQV